MPPLLECAAKYGKGPVGAGSRGERRRGPPLSGEFDEQFRPTRRRPPRRGKREDLRLLTKHALTASQMCSYPKVERLLREPKR